MRGHQPVPAGRRLPLAAYAGRRPGEFLPESGPVHARRSGRQPNRAITVYAGNSGTLDNPSAGNINRNTKTSVRPTDQLHRKSVHTLFPHVPEPARHLLVRVLPLQHHRFRPCQTTTVAPATYSAQPWVIYFTPSAPIFRHGIGYRVVVAFEP